MLWHFTIRQFFSYLKVSHYLCFSYWLFHLGRYSEAVVKGWCESSGTAFIVTLYVLSRPAVVKTQKVLRQFLKNSI